MQWVVLLLHISSLPTVFHILLPKSFPFNTCLFIMSSVTGLHYNKSVYMGSLNLLSGVSVGLSELAMQYSCKCLAFWSLGEQFNEHVVLFLFLSALG
jgi:hypothetical protein